MTDTPSHRTQGDECVVENSCMILLTDKGRKPFQIDESGLRFAVRIAAPDPGENWSGPDPHDVGEERLAQGIRLALEFLNQRRE